MNEDEVDEDGVKGPSARWQVCRKIVVCNLWNLPVVLDFFQICLLTRGSFLTVILTHGSEM